MPPPAPPKKPPLGASHGDGFDSADAPTQPGTPAFALRRTTGLGHPSLTGETTRPAPKPTGTRAAPEVSKGRFHERSTAPRAVLPPALILSGLDEALGKISQSGAAPAALRAQLKADWLPLLRQAVEQAGGDGLDAYVTQLLTPPGKKASTPLVSNLALTMERLEIAPNRDALVTSAQQVRKVVADALAASPLYPISLRRLELDLDGRLEVDVLLSIRFASLAELEARGREADTTLESVRKQMQAMPDKHPGALFATLARLKVEKRAIEAETRRRKARR